MKTKKCGGRCGLNKPLSEFNNNKRAKDGLCSECKTCAVVRSREYKDRIKQEKTIFAKYNVNKLERDRVHRANARTRKLRLGSSLTYSQWIFILEKYKWSCAYCGGPHERLDHVKPVSRGGGTTRFNVVPSCNSCNSKKSAILLQHNVYSRGYAVGYLQALLDVRKLASVPPFTSSFENNALAGKTSAIIADSREAH
jgi:5-methylcytosine-specific restriction endonuclease McrA